MSAYDRSHMPRDMAQKKTKKETSALEINIVPCLYSCYDPSLVVGHFLVSRNSVTQSTWLMFYLDSIHS